MIWGNEGCHTVPSCVAVSLSHSTSPVRVQGFGAGISMRLGR